MRKSLFASPRPRGLVALLAAALIAVLLPSFAAAGGPNERRMAIAPDSTDIPTRFIVRLRNPEAEPGATLNALAARKGKSFSYVRAVSGGAHVVRITSGLLNNLHTGVSPKEAGRLIALELMQDPAVLYAEPDLRMVSLLVPNDPQYSAQWNYYEAAGGINLPAAWSITTGSSAITVALIDTGVRPHADLAGRTVGGYDFIADASISNDGDGRDADPSDPGDYCGSSASSWHGTHVAGTIGAASNNGVGVTGVNWVSKILVARVLGACGGYTSDIIDAMRWSAGIAVAGVPNNPTPARVENLSLGGSGACSNALQSAVNDVIARGTNIVVAAGNSGSDVSGSSPANCIGVIAVGATDRNGGKASFSNFGTGVTISAPGVSILSTLNTGATTPGSDSYAYYSGTSMAAPHVTGVISLMLSQNPMLTPAQVKTQLQATARAFPTGTGADCTSALCGAGIVDATAAIMGAPSANPRVNRAAAANGAIASASSVYGSGYAAANVINGDHKGLNPAGGASWNDGTADTFPDWVRIDFPTQTSLSEIDVYGVQDNWANPTEPTEAMTFSKYGLVDFDVQYWDGTNWTTVSGGSVTGNRQVWRKFTFTAISTTAIRVLIRASLDSWSRVVEIEAYGDAAPINVARPLNGGVASASSSYSSNYPASGAIDGDRLSVSDGHGSGWNDGTANSFPDWLQVTFSGTKTINEIDVFCIQDNYANPSPPTRTMTFTKYGIVDFDVQYWNGTTWATVPGGSVTGNNLVWRQFIFSAVSTSAIRILVRSSLDSWSRIAELEAYSVQ